MAPKMGKTKSHKTKGEKKKKEEKGSYTNYTSFHSFLISLIQSPYMHSFKAVVELEKESILFIFIVPCLKYT